jgi:hypothetical protein
MDMLSILLISFAVVLVLINIHLGKTMSKRHGGWQYGILNWGMAAYLGFTIIETLIK